jgi:dipeptidyl aminopeptidase/acylaminoacyl peptidase
MVVAGGSAGGYLTMMVGVVIRPRPAALVAYYGYGDIDGDWYSKPSPHYRKQPLVSRETALGGLDGKVTTGKMTKEQADARGRYYLYLRQNGLWTREISGFEPGKDRAKLDALCPVRNITADYPPILMLHGDQDTDVPFQQSVDMDRELTRQNVPHEFIPVPGTGHGLHGGNRKLAAAAKARALEYIQQHLSK